MMEKLELVGHYIEQGKTIDELWNMFLMVHFTFIGGIYFADRLGPDLGIRMFEKAIFVIGYAVFALINSQAKIDAYEFIIHLSNEINKISELDKSYALISDYFGDLKYEQYKFKIYLAHSIGGIIVFSQLFRHELARVGAIAGLGGAVDSNNK